MKTIGKTFLAGLVAIVPLAVTIYVLYWLGDTAGTMFKDLLEGVLPDSMEPYLTPGMGLAAGVVLIFLIGLLLRAWLFRLLFNSAERLLGRIPLVKTLYGSVRDLMGFFATADKEQRLSQVVMVRVGDTDVRMIGLLTREDFSDVPGVGSEDTVGVYLPMSYQIGGFLTMVPRSSVEPIDMSMEDAMRFAVTAGMKRGKEGERREPSPPGT